MPAPTPQAITFQRDITEVNFANIITKYTIIYKLMLRKQVNIDVYTAKAGPHLGK